VTTALSVSAQAGGNLDHRAQRLSESAASAALHVAQALNVPCRSRGP